MSERGSLERAVPAAVDIDGRAFADALAEATQSLVCVLDRAGQILLFNEACERATGFSRDEVVGADARDCVIPPEEAEAFGGVLAHIWDTGLASPQVGHWLTRDGGRLLVAWSNKPVLGEDGTPLYLVTSGLDITDRERSQEELHALEGNLEAKLAEVGRLAQEQTALRRVATLVAAEASPERVFAAVSEQSARVLEATASAVFRFDASGTATVVGRYTREGIGAFALGSTVPLNPYSAIGRVYLTGEPARIDNYEELPGEVAAIMQRIGFRCTVAAPISVSGAVWGAAAVASAVVDALPPQSEVRLGEFCDLVSLAVASAHAREELRASRARIVQAGDEERRRLERNLHDGAQQRLVSLSIALRLARSKLPSDPGAAAELLEAASRDVEEATRELRELARGLHPGILSDRGLRPALNGLAERSPLPVVIANVPGERLPHPVEAAVYYIVAESLTNVAKHAHASSATVTVSSDERVVIVEVSDDGRGGAGLADGSGLVGLRDRVEALGGSLALNSPPGEGTVVRAVLPLEPRS